MDRTLTYAVADLALDEGLALRCGCRVRTFGRADLAALVGHDARLHLIGLRRELWCPHCGEPVRLGKCGDNLTVCGLGERLQCPCPHGAEPVEYEREPRCHG